MSILKFKNLQDFCMQWKFKCILILAFWSLSENICLQKLGYSFTDWTKLMSFRGLPCYFHPMKIERKLNSNVNKNIFRFWWMGQVSTGILFILHHRFHEFQQVFLALISQNFTVKSRLASRGQNFARLVVKILKCGFCTVHKQWVWELTYLFR